MGREQFTFYRSFWDALKELPKKDQLPFVMAICSYAFDEESKPLTGAASASFLLVKPILDKASKKAANGKQGGSKPKASRKQIASKKEGEEEIEKEGEIELEVESECYPPTPLPPTGEAASVLADYLNRINPTASQTSLDELRGYAEVLGEAVCKRAFDIALDNKATNWPYIRAILRDKQSNGVRCLADWNNLEERRKGGKRSSGSAAPSRHKAAPGENVARMREYLEKGRKSDEK